MLIVKNDRIGERAEITKESTVFQRFWRRDQANSTSAAADAPRLRPLQLDRSFPLWMRAFVRGRESGLLVIAAIIGALSGLLVAAMSVASQEMHEIFFQIPHAASLSVTLVRDSWRVVAFPFLGGAILALLGLWAKDRFRGRLADAIEANALHGGRLSARGSLYISAQTLISNGFGASVGLEAAYTQMCGMIASLLGRGLGARRVDMRLLVGCGAAGAIAAAFDAPFAGAFYAFEAILGAYSVSSLMPVAISAVLGTVVADRLLVHKPILAEALLSVTTPALAAHAIIIAFIASAASVVLMEGVALVERSLDALSFPKNLRPIAGGLLVGGLGLLGPEALGAGHGARGMVLTDNLVVTQLLFVLALKGLASAVSLGAGFRGGLFFASLLIGALVGRLYGESLDALSPLIGVDPTLLSILGMAAVGAGIIGAPLAMTFLALEATSDFRIMVAALLASALSGLIVRETFGYSFATWRFHLRGEAIRGPQDIGWVRDLKVARLMRKDFRAVAADRTIAAARILFPVGIVKELFLTQANDAYVGTVLVSDLHAAASEDSGRIDSLAHWVDDFLVPQSTIRAALDLFEKSEADVLPVLADAQSRRIVGTLSEAHALRAYGRELEKRNRELIDR
ncbi:chloride channel protein [Methylocapsa sp. S129]|uniref:chloride channel protein n=1 Tax=Methylocapsa sp. S129 TaxID=1641869 RepID=UPI00131AE0C3|nr:chloride channel protein [Methylocapsa sp. S129]